MRDLANQNILRRRRAPLKAKKTLFIIVAAVAAFWIVSWKLNGSATTTGATSANLKDAPKGLTPVAVSGAAVNAESGINVSTGTATLTDIKYGGAASGTATRTFGDGTYSLSVTATLPDPKGGDKYEVWLYDGNIPYEAGFMSGSKTSWSLVFRDKDKLSAYKEVWVTRELTSEDGEPENKVLVGRFK